jgi:AcrR family transcriptional regulator
MPPKAKLNRGMILDAGLRISRASGFDAVNARSLARELGCSTSPLFGSFRNIDELKSELLAHINRFFGDYLRIRAKAHNNTGNGFLRFGLAYVDFAKNEKELFKALFMSSFIDIGSFSELISAVEHDFIIREIPRAKPGMDGRENAEPETYFMHLWIYAHGIATMIATNAIDISDEEIVHLLKNAGRAFRSV